MAAGRRVIIAIFDAAFADAAVASILGYPQKALSWLIAAAYFTC
jgi:hypothetical protein